MRYVVLSLQGATLCEAMDHRSAALAADWFRDAGTPCVVRPIVPGVTPTVA